MSSDTPKFIDIVFDGPPSHESGTFVEVEDCEGKSINFGEWIEREDGYWALRIADPRELAAAQKKIAMCREFIRISVIGRGDIPIDVRHGGITILEKINANSAK